MNITRNGKIARLPRAVRQELNGRLAEGEQGKRLVAWLNELPEVQAIVTAEFGGKPVREQNLSEWKQGGYRDWLAQQEAKEVAERLGEDAAEWEAEGRPPLTDTLALWLAARYAVATRRVAETEGAEAWRLLREMCGDLVELRRGDHSAARLKLEQERSARWMEAKFEEWLKQPEVMKRVGGSKLTEEERARRVREIFGLAEPRHGLSADGLGEIEKAARLL